MLKVCRFCLCDEEECLIPLEDMLDFAHTMQDVTLFTGIQIDEDNITSYATCLECSDKLNSFATFRKTCLGNDLLFQELCATVTTSVKETLEKNDETIEYVNIEMDVDEEEHQPEEKDNCKLLDFNFKNDRKSTNSRGHIQQSHLNSCSAESISPQSAETVQEEENSYSANYINPGEDLFTDNGLRGAITDWSCYYCPPKWPYPPLYNKTGKRRRMLCDICGLFVAYIPTHVAIHYPDAPHACPYCPVKMKQRFVLLQHIRTVHLKVVLKTCHICKKGFVHRKTYVYHMRAHEDAGNSFECQVCSKVFRRSIGLEEHIRKMHSFAKSVI